MQFLNEKQHMSEFYRNLNKKIENIEKQILLQENHKLNDKVSKLEKYIEQKFKCLEEKFIAKVDHQKEDINKSIKLYNEAASAVNKKSKKETTTVITNLNENIKTIKSTIEDKIESEKEQRIQKAKSNNLIIFNVPESKGSTSEAYEEDIQKIQQIFTKKIGLQENDLKDVYRRKIKDTSKTRPIILKFNNMEKRQEALKARDLYYIEEETKEITRIGVDIDRTIEQQKIRKKLVQDLKQRKSQGIENVRIIGDQVVEDYHPNFRQCWKSNLQAVEVSQTTS